RSATPCSGASPSADASSTESRGAMSSTSKGGNPMHAAIRYALAACLVAVACCFSDSAAAAQGKIELQWFGQSAFKITTVNGKVIVIDPWLTKNPLTPQEYKNLDAIGKMDILLVTHAHGDHLGDGPELAKKYDAPLWGPAGLDQSLQTLGILP